MWCEEVSLANRYVGLWNMAGDNNATVRALYS